MTLVEFRAALRLHLKDAATTWSDAEIDRCVTHATEDLSRYMPREQVFELTLDFDETTSATWTSASAAGTYVALAHKPIKYDSETVTDGTNACVRDTDYIMDYWNGKITHISGGEIENSDAANTITYIRDQTTIDLSSKTDLIRVLRCEYPVGNMPQHKVAFDVFDDKLVVTGFPQAQEKQQNNMMNEKHLRVWYAAQHSMPTVSADGSAPPFTDEIIIKGAEGYLWLIEASQYEQQAITDLAEVRTTLGYIGNTTSGVYKDVDTACDAVVTELGLANTALDDIGAIGATAHAAITTALGLINSTADLGVIALGDLPDGSSPDYHALADTAFDAAATQLALGPTPLADLPDASSPDYHALAATALAASATELGKVWAASTGDFALANTAHTDVEKHVAGDAANDIDMDYFLDLGLDKIPTVNVGDRVAEMYVKYAQAASQMAAHYENERRDYLQQAQIRVGTAAGYKLEADGKMAQVQAKIAEANGQANLALGFISEGKGRLEQLQTKIAEAGATGALASAYAEEVRARLNQMETIHNTARQRIATAEGYGNEASFRLYLVDRMLGEADRYIATAGANFELADRLRDMGILRRNEFWAILGSRSQGKIDRHSSSTQNF